MLNVSCGPHLRRALWAVLSFCLASFSIMALPCFAVETVAMDTEQTENAVSIYSSELPGHAEFDSETGDVTGFGIELCREIARRSGDTLDIGIKSWMEAIAHARGAANQGAIPTSRIAEREGSFKWVGPVGYDRLWLYAQAESNIKIRTLRDASHVSGIAVVRGSVYETFLMEEGFTNLVSMSTRVQCAEALVTGRVALMVADEDMVKALGRRVGRGPHAFRPVFLLYENPSYIAFSLDTPDRVVNRWQVELSNIKRDGTYDRLVEHWFPDRRRHYHALQDGNHLILSPAERKWLAAHPVVRVASDPHYPPFDFQTEDGQHLGLSSDYIEILERETGIDFIVHPTSSWAEALLAFKGQGVDMLASVVPTVERRQYMKFTDPYQRFPVVVFTRDDHAFFSDIRELKDETIGVVKGYFFQETLRRDYPEIRLVCFDSVEEALQAVSSGEVDSYAGNIVVARYVIQREGLVNLKEASRITAHSETVCMGVRSDWPELVSIVNKVMEGVPAAERGAIYDKWVSRSEDSGVNMRLVRVWAIRVGVVVLGVLLFMSIMNRRLRREVHERKAAEEKLAENERLYRDLFNNAQVGMFQCRLDGGRYLRANHRMAEMFGYDDVETFIQEFIPSDSYVDGSHRQQMLQTLNRWGRISQFSTCFYKRDGSSVCVQYSLQMDDATGIVTGVAEDVTRRYEMERRIRESEELYRSVVESSNDGIVIVDEERRVVFFNTRMADLFGVTADSSVLADFVEAFVPDERADVHRYCSRSAADTLQTQMLGRDGEAVHVELSSSVIVYDGRPARLAIIRDITERRQSEQALRDREQRLAMALDSADYGMWELWCETGVMEVPERLFRENLGFEPKDIPVLEADFRELVHPEDRLVVDAAMLGTKNGERDEFSFEVRIRDSQGNWRWASGDGRVVERDASGAPLRMLGVCADITARKADEERLRELAVTDGLTSLYTRRHFMNLAEREFRRSKRYAAPLSLLMLDADFFKKINDTYGHVAGDAVLKNLAQVAREVVREVDVIGRLGGEEFAILLPETDEERATAVAERLRTAIEAREVEPVGAGIEPIRFTVSIGVASVREEDENLESVMLRSDAALYEAKEIGRNIVVVAEP